MLFAIVILAIVGVSNAWAGYAIKYQRRYHLIAGYDAKRDGEPEALARVLGNGGIALGVVCAAGITGLLVKPDAMEAVIRVVGFAGLIVVIVIAVTPWRYVLQQYLTAPGDPWHRRGGTDA